MEERILHVLDLIQNLEMLSDTLDSIAFSSRHSQLMHKSAEKAGRTQTMKNWMSADLPRKRDDSEWEDDGRGRLKGRIAIDIWRIFPLLLFFQEGNFFAVKRFYSLSSPLSYNSALSSIIYSAKSLGSPLDVGQKKKMVRGCKKFVPFRLRPGHW